MSLQDRVRALRDEIIERDDFEAQWIAARLDALLSQPEERGAVRAVLESVYRIVVNGHCSQDVVTVIGKMRDASDLVARPAVSNTAQQPPIDFATRTGGTDAARPVEAKAEAGERARIIEIAKAAYYKIDPRYASVPKIAEVIVDAVLASRPSPAANTEGLRETAWLIEGPGPQWWDGFWFCTDSLDAVRFARKQDAEKVIQEVVLAVPTINAIDFKAVEHAWLDAALRREETP